MHDSPSETILPQYRDCPSPVQRLSSFSTGLSSWLQGLPQPPVQGLFSFRTGTILPQYSDCPPYVPRLSSADLPQKRNYNKDQSSHHSLSEIVLLNAGTVPRTCSRLSLWQGPHHGRSLITTNHTQDRQRRNDVTK